MNAPRPKMRLASKGVSDIFCGVKGLGDCLYNLESAKISIKRQACKRDDLAVLAQCQELVNVDLFKDYAKFAVGGRIPIRNIENEKETKVNCADVKILKVDKSFEDRIHRTLKYGKVKNFLALSG
jgi:hypothetical protein